MFSQTLRRAAAQSARSPFAGKYAVNPHISGITLNNAIQYGSTAAAFGVSAGVFALFLFGEVPRVRKDILQKLPFFDTYLDRTVPPEDNPY
ncbi:ubiquinol-cytochrome-c reductase complex subunit-domain-containing protein [Aspergillus cavernicola]|uniref:Ubiquinol-cytochrome-c reductase complex subunit-domain-containing protein n=1 Tax=Aspergillus cavernicola TaxID=176166 RepID=A0ABR4J465_9EURO